MNKVTDISIVVGLSKELADFLVEFANYSPDTAKKVLFFEKYVVLQKTDSEAEDAARFSVICRRLASALLRGSRYETLHTSRLSKVTETVAVKLINETPLREIFEIDVSKGSFEYLPQVGESTIRDLRDWFLQFSGVTCD